MKKSPRQRRKEKKITVILDAAKELISEVGFENVSLREIAKASDYSPAALYKYFDNKEAIFQAVKERENENLINILAALDKNLSPPLYLIESCLHYIHFMFENPTYLTLINNLPLELHSNNEFVPKLSPYLIFLEAVRSWLEYEKVQLPDGYGIEEVTYALWAQIHGMSMLRNIHLRDFKADFDMVNRKSIENFLKGIKS